MATGLLGSDREIIDIIIGFLGTQAYLSVASVSTQWRNAWGRQPTVTNRRWAVQSRSCLDWARACGLDICDSPSLFAAAAGRLDVVQHAVALGYSREGMPICEWAAGGGHMEVVKWCRKNGYLWGMSSIRAAEGGHLEVLKWCVANGCPTKMGMWLNQMLPRGHYRGEQPYQRERIFDVFDAAAWGGHLETVMWCRDQGYEWSQKTSYMALEGGHMDVLRWLVVSGCPLDPNAFMIAARSGDLEILEWIVANGCPWDPSAVVEAAEGGNLEVVKWCVANDPNNPPGIDRGFALAKAAGRGDLEIVQWMRANGVPWGDRVCYMAACGDHLEVLKWCLANGCPWGFPTTIYDYGLYVSVSTMMWAASNGCSWVLVKHVFDVMCKHAATWGNLEVLKWCTTYRPLPISEVARGAASKGQVHILEWLRASGKLSVSNLESDLCTTAATSGSLETVKWCRTNNVPWGSAMSEFAILSRNLELMQWCRANGCPWGMHTVGPGVVPGDIEVIAWCHANGCPLDASSFRNLVSPGCEEIKEWCREHLPC